MRSFLTHITLYGLLAVSVISVLPLELMLDWEDESITFLEGETEKEEESKKEGKDKKKEKEEREKQEEKNKKSKKYHQRSRDFDVIVYEQKRRKVSLQPTWDPPFLDVISPPPESVLG